MANRHDNRYLQLGLNIAYYRKLKGYTQIRLAEIAGIRRTHMSNIEASGVEKSVSLDVFFDIAEALGVEPGKLLEIRGWVKVLYSLTPEKYSVCVSTYRFFHTDLVVYPLGFVKM